MKFNNWKIGVEIFLIVLCRLWQKGITVHTKKFLLGNWKIEMASYINEEYCWK